ncbi:MAG: Biotin carboxyl carrier protein of acetyl-CoA carboxylase [Firmicutes bacterium ADurb.Bin456]|nr:MAG: Biotin carboxyl carrier protein of acetyl-CoA carboxylase [Firmicutes bacterium ADurb.Bin456]
MPQRKPAVRIEEKPGKPIPEQKQSVPDPGSKGSLKEERKMNLDDVRELIKLVNETGITEVKLESDGVKLAIKKGLKPESEQDSPHPDKRSLTESPEFGKTTPAKQGRTQDENQPPLIPVTSPMVGTFYRAPAPEASPYVSVGEYISKGQTLCIIEAMKLMNKIDSEIEGEIVEITVENGSPVEYGQTLFLIKQ